MSELKQNRLYTAADKAQVLHDYHQLLASGRARAARNPARHSATLASDLDFKRQIEMGASDPRRVSINMIFYWLAEASAVPKSAIKIELNKLRKAARQQLEYM